MRLNLFLRGIACTGRCGATTSPRSCAGSASAGRRNILAMARRYDVRATRDPAAVMWGIAAALAVIALLSAVIGQVAASVVLAIVAIVWFSVRVVRMVQREKDRR